MDIEERVKHIIRDQLGVRQNDVTHKAKFSEDLGADSLDTVELVMTLEEEFDMEISDQETEHVQTVGDAIALITKRVSSSAQMAGNP